MKIEELWALPKTSLVHISRKNHYYLIDTVFTVSGYVTAMRKMAVLNSYKKMGKERSIASNKCREEMLDCIAIGRGSSKDTPLTKFMLEDG